MAAKVWPALGSNVFWVEKDLYTATPAVTLGIDSYRIKPAHLVGFYDKQPRIPEEVLVYTESVISSIKAEDYS